MKLNLIDLNDKNSAILIDGQAIDPGRYEWLAMDVNADFDGVLDSFVMTKIGGQEELRVPSGRVRLSAVSTSRPIRPFSSFRLGSA